MIADAVGHLSHQERPMKKSPVAHAGKQPPRLSLRSETVRMLTQHELILIVAGNCVQGSSHTHNETNALGVC
jgi:hypothetical protein